MLRLAAGVVVVGLLIGWAMPARLAKAPAPVAADDRPPIVVDAPRPERTGAASPSYGQEMVLERDGTGQFRLDAEVNGQSLPFLVDTGADTVALTVDAARQVGFYVDPASFQVVGSGASGEVRGTHVVIRRLDVAGRSINDVDAMVLDGLGTNLLGQNVLGKIGGVDLQGDRMRIR